MTAPTFNNLLKVFMNIESDSENLQGIQTKAIAFKPKMLTFVSSPPTRQANINDKGLLVSSSKMNMKRLLKQGTNAQTYYNGDCLEYSPEKEERLKEKFIQKWNGSIETDLVTQFHNYDYGADRDERIKEDNIKSNMDFLICLFFKKYESLTALTGINDDNIYLIIDKKIKEPAKITTDTASYKTTYEITINLTVIDLFKPAYLQLKLDRSKPAINHFFPSMVDDEIEDIKNSEETKVPSLFFSPFIPLNKTLLTKLPPLTLLEKRKLFTDEKVMRKWMIDSFNINKKIVYNWRQTLNKDIPKNNIKLIIDLFLSKGTVLAVNEKEYEITSNTIVNNPIDLSIDTALRMVCDYSITAITLKETININLVILDIKLLIENMTLSKKNGKKEKTNFIPKMVNKNIEETTIYFIPYLEIPSVEKLRKLNENYMRLFTVPTEFLKLVTYLKHTSKEQKKYDLTKPADKAKIDKIIEKNIQQMINIFFPLNGEIFLNRELITAYSTDNKKYTKEEKKFYISKSIFKPPYLPSTLLNSVGLPTKYTILVDLSLAETRLTILDFYKLSCKEKTSVLDDKLEAVLHSAFPSVYNTIGQPPPPKTTYFTELMEPDEKVNTLEKMRPAVLRTSLKRGGRALHRRRGGKLRTKRKSKKHLCNKTCKKK